MEVSITRKGQEPLMFNGEVIVTYDNDNTDYFDVHKNTEVEVYRMTTGEFVIVIGEDDPAIFPTSKKVTKYLLKRLPATLAVTLGEMVKEEEEGW